MIISRLQDSGLVYSCNVYLITGDWKRLEDITTVIDVGSDPAVLDHLEQLNTGIGKKKIEQVVLTHSHSDHTALLPLIRERYQPQVLAFYPFTEGIDRILVHGEHVRMGDRDFEVIHTPGHSMDSISLFNRDEGVLFVGDTPVIIRTPDGGYETDFVAAMGLLCRREVKSIYFGHGNPITQGAQSILRQSLQNIKKANQHRPPVLPEESRC